jgi:Spy/CpxP family protein refolding chaperone
LLVFLAGGATGIFVTMAVGHHFMVGHHVFAAQAMKNRLQWQLRLTDEQMAKISPIIEKTGTQLEEIRGDTGRRVREAIAQAHQDIAPILTPEQKERLQQMEQRQRRWMHRGHWHAQDTGTPEASPQ